MLHTRIGELIKIWVPAEINIISKTYQKVKAQGFHLYTCWVVFISYMEWTTVRLGYTRIMYSYSILWATEIEAKVREPITNY